MTMIILKFYQVSAPVPGDKEIKKLTKVRKAHQQNALLNIDF